MDCSWVFRDYVTDAEINSALCAIQTDVEGVTLVGPAGGYQVRWMSVAPVDDGVEVVVFVERPLKITSTVLLDGRVIE